MSELLAEVKRKVHPGCLESRISKEGCKAKTEGLPEPWVLVDLDCSALHLPAVGRRCDYVFLHEDKNSSWVTPIELKAGRFKAGHVVDQLQGGVDIAATWIPQGTGFRLIPVLMHGKGISKPELKRLRNARITLRGRKAQVVLIHCGKPLMEAL